MKDLTFTYEENGVNKKKAYDLIFNFTDGVESNDSTVPSLDCQNVEACFFESPLHIQHFDTVKDLYEHCKKIMC